MSSAMGRFGVAVVLCLTTAAARGATPLEVVSAAPQGALEGSEQQRVQIVFSAAVVPLGEAAVSSKPPSWLLVEPPMLARWRWAGTRELVGEPLAPLPRATAYTLRLAPEFAAIDGSRLAEAFSFSFTTPRPETTMMKGADADPEAFPVVLTFNQPVDPGSLAAHLSVKIAPSPLSGAEDALDAVQLARLERDDPEAAQAYRRFLAEARGPAPSTPPFTLEPDPEFPHRVFHIVPLECWPRAASVEVDIEPGVRGLEGSELSDRPFHSSFPTRLPFAPLRFSGRTAAGREGFDPESVQLVFSADVAWRGVAPFLTYRQARSEKWRTIEPFPEEWAWEWEDTELRLYPLDIGGGQEVEVCLAAEASDIDGRMLGFPWCGRFRTSHATPSFYLVEGDGVVEWNGPHLLPLRSRNVTSYRLERRRVAEEELTGLLASREEREAQTVEGEVVDVKSQAERSLLTPIALDPALAGKPGIVLTRLAVRSVVEGSEYDDDEAKWLREPRVSLTQVTSLGLTVKGSRTEGLLVWVTRLAEVAPLAGAEVVARDKGNVVLWRGTTDEHGLARTPPEVGLDTAFLVTARLGDDFAYARTTWWEGHRGWEFNLPVDYHEQVPVIGHVWTDRGVVRPGETLHAKAVVRRRAERALELLSLQRLTFVVRDPDGGDILVEEVAHDPMAGAEVEIPLAETARLGSYDVLVGTTYDREKRVFPDAQEWSVGSSFRVAEFRRPKFRVEAASEKERLVAGDLLAVKAEGRLLAGGAMVGAQASWTVRARRWWYRPQASRWSGWEFLPLAFIDDEDLDSTTVVASGQGALDASGALALSVPHVEGLKGWPAELTTEVEVSDVDRQSSTATARVAVLPGEFALGVERPPFFVDTTKGVDTRVVALSPDGTPLAGVTVDVLLLRRHWESVRRREVSGRYLFSSEPVVEELARTQAVTGSEPIPVHFAISEAGELAIVARAADRRGNRVEASRAFYAFGGGYTPWRLDQENRIELVPERDTYAPGDEAKVLVKSPWESTTALVTVERAGVLEARIERLTGTMPTIAVKLAPEYTPNVFVSVVLLRGRVEAKPDPELIDPGRPAYRVGYCELRVPPAGKRMTVQLATAKKEYRPGQEVEASVQVTSESGTPQSASVTLWAVDAGVLSLTGYRTPDLMSTFFARRGLGVTTAESRSRLVGRRSYGTKGDKPGGGGGVETTGEQVRRDFRALAFWQGIVATDAQGRATVRFRLPDSLTTYRLMAVAVAGNDQFGASETEFIATKPLGLEPALPRFLRPTDRARAGVVVRNRTKTEQQVEVVIALAPGGPIALRGTASRVAKVAAGGSTEVGFGLVAVAPGVAKVGFTVVAAQAKGERDAIEVSLPVLPIQPTETTATFFSTSDTAREAITVPTDVLPAVGGLTVRLAPTALIEAESAVRFLKDYPHACAEQVSSRVLGLVAARRLGQGFAPTEVDGMTPEAWLAWAVAKLVACQRSDGGFAFWPGGDSYDVLSAYVTWALVEARKLGVSVEDRVLDEAATYLSQGLRQERRRWGPQHDWTARVLFSFALARLGRPEPGYFQLLNDRRNEEGSLWGRALLAATMLEVNRSDPRAAELIREVCNSLAIEARTARLEEKEPEWGWWVFWSEPRGSAAALLALLAADPLDPTSEKLARGLLDHLSRDRFQTTHATAWALQALAAYRERHERGLANGKASATLSNERLVSGEFDGTTVATLDGTVGMQQLMGRAAGAPGRTLPLEVSLSGSGMVHGAAVLAYAPKASSRPALANGIGLSRRFLDRSSRPVRRVEAGDEVVVEITVDCPATRRFVAVEAPIPAGLEALDPELVTTATAAAEDEEPEETSEWEWEPGFDHAELRDDRIVLYATELPAGKHVRAVRCRATTSGTFAVAPGRAQEMYAPEVFGTTAADSFEVAAGSR